MDKNSVFPEQYSSHAGDQVNKVRAVLGECKHAFALVLIFAVGIELLSIVPILYMLNMYDRVLTSRSEVTLVSLTIMVLGIYIFWAGLEWVQRRMLVRISLRIDWDMAMDLFDVSFRRSVNRKGANVHQVIADLGNLRHFLTGGPLLALISAPFSLLFILVCGLFHPSLAFFALGALVLLIGITYITQRVSTPMLYEANNASSDASRLASNALRQAETALALGMQRSLRKQWYERHQAALAKQVGASEAAGMLAGFSSFLNKALPSVQMALGIYLAVKGLITAGMVIAATTLLTKAIGPLQKVLGSWKEIANARQSYQRLAQLFAEDDKPESRMALPAPKGHLNVADLTIQPANCQRPVLDAISFTLSPGQVLAIVGPSAAGKSSLIKSLTGIWPAHKGSVRLDGASVAEWAQEDLGQYIGYIPQETEFFEGSIAQNIARLNEVDSEKVVKAATLAGMHEMILSFPQGYDTKLGETGFVLTGGQKQRLALARALYGDPRYVIMDEPNASLDDQGERCLVQAIKTLKASSATVVFTTHRSELIRFADMLLVLANGRQVAFGAVADVLTAVRNRQTPSASGARAQTEQALAANSPTPVKQNDGAAVAEGIAPLAGAAA